MHFIPIIFNYFTLPRINIILLFKWNYFTLFQGDMEFIYVNFTILFLTQAVVDQCASKYYY